MNINNFNKNISFLGGLKKNLRLGEKVLHDFKKDFPYITSSSLWRERKNRVEERENKPLFECRKIINLYSVKIKKMRESLEGRPNSEDKRTYNERLREEVQKRGYGNCGEISDLLSSYLKQRGIEYRDMSVVIQCPKRYGYKDHTFKVIGMEKYANPRRPDTWGNNAVIIDGWRNFVLSVPDGIREYEKLYGTEHRKNNSNFLFFDRKNMPYYQNFS